MQPVSLERPASLEHAAHLGAVGGEFIAGGTDMVQLLKEWVRRPSRLVDLHALLDADVVIDGRCLRIGAGACMEQVATHPDVARLAPVVAEALLESASPQVRNMATMGGNLLQRTRCGYFRDVGVAACNKRLPGSGCAAIAGENRIHAVLGTSDGCIAAHPSDLAVALVALDASLCVLGPDGNHRIALDAVYRTWDTNPDQETTLHPGDVITAIEIPTGPLAQASGYVKLRDRAAFEWALLSAAVALEVADGTVRQARIAMGGVGTKPWRMRNVEGALIGRPATLAAFAAAAALSTEGAVTRGRNAFKTTLMPKLLTRALAMVADAATKVNQ
jgi:xanthine dehydrogenase YagS FAD-binding subunit